MEEPVPRLTSAAPRTSQRAQRRLGSVITLVHSHPTARESFFIDILLVQIHLVIVMIRRTGLASLEFEFPFPGSLTANQCKAGSLSKRIDSCIESCKEEDEDVVRESQPGRRIPSEREHLLNRSVQRFRGGLVFKAHRLFNHSTLGLRVIKKKKKPETRDTKPEARDTGPETRNLKPETINPETIRHKS